ncbi:hypothetical protein HIM_05178 [Hirsutella minnesotensis 3608]|uniref:Phytase-like domain-containing protein n=1 Tax=Hirsutella minnesotensis 3608 TaxID=1043627 RepID=A0A0F8A0M4_9HYPO|nr:hypothetical protein HIM_05178 [Hirsutella minnesotensis 3608]
MFYFTAVLLLGSLSQFHPVHGAPTITPPGNGTVDFDGRSFVNKGLVGFGRINGSSVDKFGETLGGLGSSIVLESFKPSKDGAYTGTLRLNPDRGHNTVTTTDYRARSHTFSFTFNPSNSNATGENVALKYETSILYRTDPDSNFTTGLDAIGVGPISNYSRGLPIAPSNRHVSFDIEGSAPSNQRNVSFISDEYGPYIYTIESDTGMVLAATAPPDAILPMIDGRLNFTSEKNPTSGRAINLGFEGLTFHSKTGMLNRHTRLLGYDARDPLKLSLKSEYVVPLPQSSSGKTYPPSELHAVDANTFLILSRDNNGLGENKTMSQYKQADLASTKGATNIAGSKYDQAANPVTTEKGMKLNPDIKPATYQPFLSLIDKDQLSRFGLHNGGKADRDLIAAKLESLAIANLVDPNTNKATGDQLLFVVSDNDFITAKGHQAAQVKDGSYKVEPYADKYAVDNKVDCDTQVFIYRVTLPGWEEAKAN